MQSLCHFLHHELSEYHRLLAVLETQMTLTAPSQDESVDKDEDGKPAEGAGMTLLRLGLWTEEMRLKLRLMAGVVDDAKGECSGRMLSPLSGRMVLNGAVTHGGALVSKIHSHTSHGDPLVRHFMDQILEEVSLPHLFRLMVY